MAVVALITDFGVTDWYAGALKGSILSVDETIPVVDITHSITPGNIALAAFTLSRSFESFPERTVFCTLVDPEVKSTRRALAVMVHRRYIVGPDNGVLSYVVTRFSNATVRTIDNFELLGILSGDPDFTDAHSHHDIFGLAAGFLASRGTFSSIGTEITDMHIIPYPATSLHNGTLITSVLTTDNFGNIITAAPADSLEISSMKRRVEITTPSGKETIRYVQCYADVGEGSLLVYPGSSGNIEIAVRGGDAASLLKCTTGTALTLSVV